MRGLPEFDGETIALEWRDGLRVSRGRIAAGGAEVHAAAFLRDRRLVLDAVLRKSPAELRRILVHELFHFVWLRLGNARRRSWEEVLQREMTARARGDLGWSAESRKVHVNPHDWMRRTRRWREYACEAYCDTAAFLLRASRDHEEFTLALRQRERRRRWFLPLLETTLRI